ncbi:hypothetical protein [Pseudomonas fluorescens]|uniref:hypothetical protein n=1 Tax=Pseudomonas fluorescens TaxID=294 RepID=UPI000ACECA19|nr:hypothetical protein [Pseudomonas fluorescens]
MKTVTIEEVIHVTLGVGAILLLAVTALTGCAQSPDARHSWQQVNGPQELDRFAYLDCVDKRVDMGTTYTQFTETEGQLLIGSRDPKQARGVVGVREIGGTLQFSVYQADAWQTKGSLVNAAYLCSHV